ncbi:MAG TPA: hypothetical protein VJ045_09045 [Hyphomicrobiaceae bacterium]|nr:hypothetical protein [Hyphomicrobiaceae bacterium]
MRLSDYTRRLLGLAETLHRWIGALGALDRGRRERVARYADQVADTLARAACALLTLEADPGNAAAARRAVREFGRITGYVETMVAVLRSHLDGRKLAGVKRRLEQLGSGAVKDRLAASKAKGQVDRLIAAEGYVRALADGLRA